MTGRSSATTAVTRGVLAVSVLLMMMGCNGVEPTKFTTISDAKTLADTRSDLKTIFDTAAGSGSNSVSGGDVIDVACGEAYGKEFQELEIRGTYVVQGGSLDAVMAEVRAAWEKQGWDVEVTDKDRLFLETKTSSGVRVTGSATMQEAANDPMNIGVGLNATTGCLKVPESAAD